MFDQMPSLVNRGIHDEVRIKYMMWAKYMQVCTNGMQPMPSHARMPDALTQSVLNVLSVLNILSVGTHVILRIEIFYNYSHYQNAID